MFEAFLLWRWVMKTDREHILELRKELNELTQLVILMGIQVTELHSLERAKQLIETAKNGSVDRDQASGLI